MSSTPNTAIINREPKPTFASSQNANLMIARPRSFYGCGESRTTRSRDLHIRLEQVIA